MIIAKLIGGLGNQMFQYAAGRALSLRTRSELALDVSAFTSYHLHQGFEFQRIFNQSNAIASRRDILTMLGWQSSPLIKRILVKNFFTPIRRKKFVVEPHFHYWRGIESVTGDCYLSGYWQSEKYFKDVEAIIREDFRFCQPLNAKNADLSKRMQESSAVSLHIRRGDYVSNPKNVALYEVCTPEYYRSAISCVAEQVPDPKFFIFSDDIAWVKENLVIDFPHEYVDFNQGAESYNDMRMMSMCQHHVIANSSFSWWGAWLNPSKDKIVVAPQKWFANDTNTRDLCPSSWVTL